MTIKAGEHSFIQFGIVDSFTHCVFGEIRQCLPVYEDSDIAFQFIFETDSAGDADTLCDEADDALTIEVVRHCDDESPVETITFLSNWETFRIDDTHILFNWKNGLPGFPYDLEVGECFYLRITVSWLSGSLSLTLCSNCFQRIGDNCFTSAITYKADEDSFGFHYCPDSEFFNRVRLPFYLSKPQFPTERSTFRKANGATKVLSSVIRKTVLGTTDYLQELWHQRLIIALNHDDVIIASKHFNGSVVMDGDYSIAWQEFLDYPVAQATFQMQVTPFDATNTNCKTCATAITEITLADDFIPDPIGDAGTGTFNVVANDSIPCCPFMAELTFINTTYLDEFLTSISSDGVFTYQAVDPAPVITNVKVATYKITCNDGSFKEADIFASFEGSGGVVCCDAAGMDIDYVLMRLIWDTECIPANGFDVDIVGVTDPLITYSTNVPGTQMFLDLPDIVKDNPGFYNWTLTPKCEGIDGGAAIQEIQIYSSGQTAALAAWGDVEGDACAPLVTVWIVGDTDIFPGAQVYEDGGLTIPISGNLIAGAAGFIYNLSGNTVGSFTGLNCF